MILVVWFRSKHTDDQPSDTRDGTNAASPHVYCAERHHAAPLEQPACTSRTLLTSCSLSVDSEHLSDPNFDDRCVEFKPSYRAADTAGKFVSYAGSTVSHRQRPQLLSHCASRCHEGV